MICSPSLRKRTLALAIATAGLALSPEAALALPGVGVNAGVGAHFANTGLAYDVNAKVDAFGFGAQGMFWMQPGTSTSWTHLVAQMNVSPVPMLSVAPGIGGAMLSSASGATGGPMASLSAGFYPIALPVAVTADVGAAYLNGSLSLPYSAALKLSLFPVTLVGRYRGWEGSNAFRASGPEIGLEIGI